MNTVWNIFAICGIISCLVLLIKACGKIRKSRSDKEFKAWKKMSEAIYEAANKPLDEAIEILKGVGIFYSDGHDCLSEYHFKLPKCFWETDQVAEKARVFITVITYSERHMSSRHMSWQHSLLNLLAKKSRKNPGLICAITIELYKQAGGNRLFEEFFAKLPYAIVRK